MGLLLQVFSDQLLLKDVLARSDRALAVVKDLFGDAPYRQTGKKKNPTLFLPVLLLMHVLWRFARFVFAGNPCVTMAPKCDSDSPPVHLRVEPPTRLSLIDQQVCTRLKIFIHTFHFDMLKRKILFPQALNEVDVWEEECSDEDPNSSACSDYRAIQRY